MQVVQEKQNFQICMVVIFAPTSSNKQTHNLQHVYGGQVVMFPRVFLASDFTCLAFRRGYMDESSFAELDWHLVQSIHHCCPEFSQRLFVLLLIHCYKHNSMENNIGLN